MKKVTIRDVARIAEVSHVTVSNVINQTGRMTPLTREKVLKAIKKMNFYPDVMARNLARGKSDTIFFVSSCLTSPFITGVLSGVERRQFQQDKSRYSIVHLATRGTQEIKEQVLKDILYGKKADAVILITLKPGIKIIREFRKQGIPLVLIENMAQGAHVVRVDNYKGAFAATEFLIKSGKKKIAIINGPLKPNEHDEEENPVFSDRLRGYRDALEEYRMKFRENMIFNVNYFNQEDGARIMGEVKKSGQQVDAIFCAAGDIVALGIIHECRKLGIAIPADMALVGYDDISIAGIMNPALTTIRQPMYEMGKAAFDLAKGALDGELKKPREILLEPELIIRESV